MSSLQYALSLITASSNTLIYFSYFMPWLSIAWDLFALCAFIFRRGTEDSLIVFLFKWQYSVGLIYALNMLFLDDQFSYNLFKYTIFSYVPDAACKFFIFLMRYIYCLSPWIHVVITFDRLWSVYLANKIKIKRTKWTLTALILVTFGVVLVVGLFQMWEFDAVQLATATSVYNATVNKTVRVLVPYLSCTQNDELMSLVQGLVLILMRTILPFLAMLVCNFFLIRHIREVRKRVVRSSSERRENHFTFAVCFINGSFLFFNLLQFVYFVIFYALVFSGVYFNFSLLLIGQYELVQAIADLLTYMFTLTEFWVDLVFNRIFRKDIKTLFFILTGRGSRVSSDSTNTNTNNNRQPNNNTVNENYRTLGHN